MATNPTGYDAHSVETEVLSVWKARRLPPAGGLLGPGSGPTVRQYEGAWTRGDFPSLVAHRAVMADVDARYLCLTGRRAVGTLRQAAGPGTSGPSAVPALLGALGVWVGGDGRNAWDSEDRSAGVQTIVGRLAAHGALVTRDESFRVCPTCGSPRSPEQIIYGEQEGDTYLVQFPIRIEDWTVNALVWVDAPWKLLGTSALLLNPDNRYVVAGYRRRNDRELVLTSAGSLHRLRSWIPDATFEVVQEKPGREFQGIAYTYPLRHEFPMGGDLSAPAGTILSASEVSESGTGIVPLVPGHGPTDARIAARLGVSGWPLLTPKGKLDFTLMHKYAGLDLETADEFVLRDLSEAGALLAHLRVKRGVPHCALCGTPLLWSPGRAWCLEPSRLGPDSRAVFARLLPHETFPGHSEVASWPVSEAVPSEEPGAVGLLECSRCERLAPPEAAAQCACGGPRTLVRRRLLPSSGAVFGSWARFDPIPEGDPVQIYISDRRRLPMLINHLAAMSGVTGAPTDVNLTIVRSVAAEDATGLVENFGADAVRAALVRAGRVDSAPGPFPDRCRQEFDRIHRWWELSREVVSLCDPSLRASFARPIAGFVEDLEVEDRAILARWERTRSSALAHYDSHAPALVSRRVFHFVETDLTEYRGLVDHRLGLAGMPNSKRAALRTLCHLLGGLSEVLAPILPFTSESIHRSLSTERSSLFERPTAGLDRSLLNDDLVGAWDRWRTVVRGVHRFRRSLGIPPSTVLPHVVLVLAADDVADRYRAETETLARLARVERFEIGSPKDPWTGRQRSVRPVESEIQKAYPSESSQVIHLLQRMPPRRWESALGQEDLSVVVNGLPRRIFPSMVAFSDTLPPRFVPVAWTGGEMYAELPPGSNPPGPTIPPLSRDAYWLVRRLRHRLRALSLTIPGAARVAVVTAKDPLASELKAVSGPIAVYLGLSEFRVALASEEPMPPGAITGRTRTGDGWWVSVPGLAPRPTLRKSRRPGTRLARVAVLQGIGLPEEFDYADPSFVAHEEEVRALGQQLDDLLGAPLLGPSKVSAAWDQGIKSVDDLRNSSFETVSALPGFGDSIAEVVVTKLGGTVPPRTAVAIRPPRVLAEAPATSPIRAAPPPPIGPSPAGPLPGPSPPASLDVPLPDLERVIVSTPSPAPALAPEPEPRTENEEPTSPSPTEIPLAAPGAPPPEPEPAAAESPVVVEPLPPVLAPLAPNPEEAEIVHELPAPPTSELGENAKPGVNSTAGAGTIPEPLPLPETEPSGGEAGSSSPDEAPSEPAQAEFPEVLVSEPPPEAPVQPEEVGPLLPGSPPDRASPEGPEPNVVPTLPNDLPPEQDGTPPGGLIDSAPSSRETPESGPAPEPPSPSDGAVPGEQEAEPPSAPEEPGPVSEETPPGDAATIEAEPVPTPPEPPAASTSPPVEPEPPSAAEPDLSVAVETPPPEPTSESLTPQAEVTVAAPTPEPAVVAPSMEPEPPAPPSGVELTVNESLVGALGGFLESTAAGHRGVCVVRESPERIRARVGSRPIEVLWLSNIGRGPALRPTDLEGVWTFLNRKLTEERVTAFFLEGIEYLVRLHGADTVLSGLVQFDRLARENDARVWVCLTPALMKASDFERFRETFGGISGPL